MPSARDAHPDSNLLAVLPYLANERDSAPRIVERDVVADLLQVNFGLWCEVRAHSLRAFTSRVLWPFWCTCVPDGQVPRRRVSVCRCGDPFRFRHADRRLPPGDAADLLPEVAAHPE